jgi:hypothetical protein
MGMYGSVEKDTVTYGSGTWVRMHDAWVLYAGHGMVHMLLTVWYICGTRYGTHMLVLDVQTWPRGDVPSMRLTDEDVGLLRGEDCDILTQGLIGLIEYSYHQGIPSFSEVHLQRTLGLSVHGPEQF